MAQQNLYYRNIISRPYGITDMFLAFFLVFSSFPRLLLEVFIRKGFGERYFRFSWAIFLALILGVFPVIGQQLLHKFTFSRSDDSSFWLHWGTWYAFLAAFLFFSWRHEQGITRSRSVFDFSKYSLASGEFHPKIAAFKIGGKTVTQRQIETLIEPGIFFVLGVALWVFQQKLGVLLVVCSIFYALGYMSAYRMGDDFILNKIDEMIINEEMSLALLEGKTEPGAAANDLRFLKRLPEEVTLRRKLHSTIVKEEPEITGAKNARPELAAEEEITK